MTDRQREWLKELPVEGRIRNRLRVAMVLEGLDNGEVARRAELQDQYVSAVATGRLINISLKNAQKLANALELTVDDLFPGNKEEDQ